MVLWRDLQSSGLLEQCDADQILRKLLLRKIAGEKKESYLKILRVPVPDAEPENWNFALLGLTYFKILN